MVKKARPVITVPYDPAVITAVQSWEKGEANEFQQKRTLEWILRFVCITYDQSYVLGDTHETAFREGRRFCGNTIIKMLKLNAAALRDNDEPSEQP